MEINSNYWREGSLLSALTVRSPPATDELPSSLPKQDVGGSGEMGGYRSSITRIEINIGTKEVLHLGHAQELWGERS